MKRKNLLDKLVALRTRKKLDIVLRNDKNYQDALKKQDLAFQTMKKLNLDKQQNLIIDRAISATTYCGAMYGAAAYKLGLHDGIKLMFELMEVKKQ
ncbi:hypothetical protein V1224_03540 [Lachnospiraceae bacterium JLR.KK008]